MRSLKVSPGCDCHGLEKKHKPNGTSQIEQCSSKSGILHNFVEAMTVMGPSNGETMRYDNTMMRDQGRRTDDGDDCDDYEELRCTIAPDRGQRQRRDDTACGIGCWSETAGKP